MAFLLKYKLIALGLVLGSLAGYTYYYWVGCASGSCPITSRPVNSTLYGALLGALLANSFQSDNQKSTTN